MRLLGAALLCCVFAFAGFAQSPGAAPDVTLERIETKAPGVYTGRQVRRERAGSLATGEYTTLENIELVEETTNVTAKLGLRFGYAYRLVGKTQGEAVPLRFVGIFPAPGLHNPDTGETKRTDEVTVTKTVGETYFDIYIFENEWELVPGQWTLQIWYKDKMMAEQTFDVIVPL